MIEATDVDDAATGIAHAGRSAAGGDPPTGTASMAHDDGEGRSVGHTVGRKRLTSVGRVFAFGLLPVLVMVIALAAAFFKWQNSSAREAQTAGIESMRAAKASTISLLSYRADTVEKDLGSARDLLTGSFRDSYTKLIHDVVIPGAEQRKISTVVDVPAVASMSATPTHAVALVFVNQTTTVGAEAPSATASSVRVTLDKVGDRWLISDFTPV